MLKYGHSLKNKRSAMITNINFFILIFTICWLICSCQNSSTSQVDELCCVAVQTEPNGKWGLMYGDGEMFVSDEFKHEPSMVTDGIFSVREGIYYSLYSVSTKLMLVSGCDDLTSVGVYKNGIIPLTHENARITIVDGNGKLIGILNSFDEKEIVGCSPYSGEGLFVVYNEDNKYGYADKSGKIVISPKYQHANLFSDGVALVRKKFKDDILNIVIDRDGKELFGLKKDIYPEDECYSYGLLKARNSDNTWGFIDKTGSFIKARGYVRRIEDYNKESFIFENDDYLWGVMGMNGDVLIRPKYVFIKYLHNGNYFASADGKYYILDKKGNSIKTIEGYDDIILLNAGRLCFAAKDGSFYTLLNADGKSVSKYKIYGFSDQNKDMTDVVTDYFDYDSVLKAFVDGLSKNGFDRYYIDMPVKEMGISNYESYVNKSNYVDTCLIKKGWKYNIDVNIQTDESISFWMNDGYDNKVLANPDAHVSSIAVTMYSSMHCWKELRDKIVEEIQSKGFIVYDKSDLVISFRGDNCRIILRTSPSGENIFMRIESLNNLIKKNNIIVERPHLPLQSKTDKLLSYNAQFFHKGSGYKTTPSGLKYVTIVEGSGLTPKANDNVTVHYTARHLNGSVFDTSLNRSKPALFPVKSLIKGWQEILSLMKVGGVVVVYIPSRLAYGEHGTPNGPVEPNEDLIFEIQLIGVN